MINYYQPKLRPFLKLSKNKTPDQLKTLYYHSFEDGLWDLAATKFRHKKKLTFLVPDFYCSDVLDNIRIRGHKYIYYPLDENFQISPDLFKKYIWLNQPDVIIIFNVCGIKSWLWNNTEWKEDVNKTAIIIEDNVHRLVNPTQVRLISDRHVVIDSLRKVSPIPGSRMFGKKIFLKDITAGNTGLSKYMLRSFYYYGLFRLVLRLGFIFNLTGMVKFAHEKLLRTHDEIIGDNLIPQAGIQALWPVINRINYKRVKIMKTRQTVMYKKIFRQLFKIKPFYQIQIPKTEFGELHVYPLGYQDQPNERLIKYLHKKNISVWFKFTDTPWSNKRGVIFLPLGFHMDEEKINYIKDTLYLFCNPTEHV